MRFQRGKRFIQLAAALFLTLGFAFAFQVKTEAAVAAPTGLKQAELPQILKQYYGYRDDNSVYVEWNAVPGNGETVYYYIMWSSNANFASYDLSGPYDEVWEAISNLKAGTTTYVKVGASTTYQTGGYPEDITWSQTIKTVTSPDPIKSTSFKYSGAAATSITVKWGKVTGATGYKIKYYKYGTSADKAKWTSTTGTSITLTKLAKNSVWNVLVFPVRKDGSYEAMTNSGYGRSGLSTLPTKVTGLDCTYFDLSVKKTDVDFSWKKNNAAYGYKYEIYKFDDTKNKKILTSGHVTKNAVTVTKKLKTRQFYKIRVRAYVTLTGNKKKYGPWSDWEYFARCGGDDIKASLSGNNVKLTWKKVAGAKNYTVYWTTSPSGKWTKLTTTKNTNYLVKKNIPYYTTYYVRVVPNRKVGKKTYKGIVNSKSSYGYSFYKYQSYY